MANGDDGPGDAPRGVHDMGGLAAGTVDRSQHEVELWEKRIDAMQMLLGRPPDWYKSRDYRSRAVREPRAVLREFGTEVADDVTVRVHDSTADMRYLVLPMRPEGSEGMSEEELARLVTRDSMIGVARTREP